MKNSFLTLLISMTLFLFSGCTTKTPYAPAQGLSGDEATLYVYRKFNGNDMSTPYRLYINEKLVKDPLLGDGYMPFRIKSGTNLVRAYRDIINQHTVKFDAVAGMSYYVGCESSADTGAFDMELQMQQEALTELKSTYYYTEAKNKTEYFPAFLKDESEQGGQSSVKTDSQEIERLYSLKEKGIITQAEFETLKAKVISK